MASMFDNDDVIHQTANFDEEIVEHERIEGVEREEEAVIICEVSEVGVYNGLRSPDVLVERTP